MCRLAITISIASGSVKSLVGEGIKCVVISEIRIAKTGFKL
ncbi:hypothetical protein C8E89_103377 [Mycolicibacterium moriokaense]|uniref:Uncharacterized protein n=1 Tax=Mycolicibacterium moriokaense TaxID=39691 RepID=A0A318HKT8_9MYCO|nr:hypothetical protein C8E89_103377 [Mycolicibacterium moriokaense]